MEPVEFVFVQNNKMKNLIYIAVVFSFISCKRETCTNLKTVTYCYTKDSADLKIEFKHLNASSQKVFYYKGQYYSSFSYLNRYYAHCKCNLIIDNKKEPVACIPDGNIIYLSFSSPNKYFFEVNHEFYFDDPHLYDYFEKNGRFVEFDSLQKIRIFGHYVRGNKNGNFSYFDSYGNLERIEKFNSDTLVSTIVPKQ